jgi:hypothetical protein
MRANLEPVVTTAIMANAAVFAWGLVDHAHTETGAALLLGAMVARCAIRLVTRHAGREHRHLPSLELVGGSPRPLREPEAAVDVTLPRADRGAVAPLVLGFEVRPADVLLPHDSPRR